jgi:hypothetical protein
VSFPKNSPSPWKTNVVTSVILQIFCIFLFLCAASLFGTIIAQVNEIVADLTTKKKDLDRILESYLTLNPRLIVKDFEICCVKFKYFPLKLQLYHLFALGP